MVDYKLFGDAITFDTTYNINKYKFIFRMFCDANHRVNFILCGIGFISSEAKESFVWLFVEFLEMHGDPSHYYNN